MPVTPLVGEMTFILWMWPSFSCPEVMGPLSYEPQLKFNDEPELKIKLPMEGLVASIDFCSARSSGVSFQEFPSSADDR